MFGPVILAKADMGEGPDQMPSRTILQNNINVIGDYAGKATARLHDETPRLATFRRAYQPCQTKAFSSSYRWYRRNRQGPACVFQVCKEPRPQHAHLTEISASLK